MLSPLAPDPYVGTVAILMGLALLIGAGVQLVAARIEQAEGRMRESLLLENRIDPALLQTFIDRAFAGVPQFFHDLGDNGDINNTSEALAHASILVQYLNRRCEALLDSRSG